MTRKQIQLVRSSWRIFQHMDPVLIGETFYGKLFADHPGLRRMFPTSMESQYKKLLDMLSTIVARLDRPEELVHHLQAMGKRHTGYGVKASHYGMVGQALLWTLELAFGKDWNAETREAWQICYREVVEQMLDDSKSAHAEFHQLR